MVETDGGGAETAAGAVGVGTDGFGAAAAGGGGGAAAGFPHTLATFRTFNATSVGVAVAPCRAGAVMDDDDVAPGGNGTLDVFGNRELLLLLLPRPPKLDNTVPGVVGFSYGVILNPDDSIPVLLRSFSIILYSSSSSS